jgi:hypothetical protein
MAAEALRGLLAMGPVQMGPVRCWRGYAAYGYAAPAYAAPATAGTTVVIVTPAPAYTAPPVVSGYYNYAPGYWGGYGWGVPSIGGAEDHVVRFAGTLQNAGTTERGR